MSKEIEVGGSNKTYYSIVGGVFTTKVPQSHPAAKERINKLGKQVFEREVGGLIGNIENIEIEQSEYGPQLKITLSPSTDQRNPVIGIGLETKHGRELLRKLPAVDLAEEVKFLPYKFTPEGADEPISGLNIFQNDLKVQSFFWNAEKKEFIGGHPVIDWENATDSKKKIYKIQRDEFLKNYLVANILPKFQEDSTRSTAEENTTAEENGALDSDDIKDSIEPENAKGDKKWELIRFCDRGSMHDWKNCTACLKKEYVPEVIAPTDKNTLDEGALTT